MTKLIVFMLSVSINSVSFAQVPKVIKIGSKSHWAPYHQDTKYGADGLAVRALACVMVRINQPFVINKLPWARAQMLTKWGKLDGFFSASKNAERDSYATQSKVFIPQTRTFYLLKTKLNKPQNQYSHDYIKNNLVVAARASSNALKSLKKGKYNIAVEPNNEQQLLTLLDIGRVDAILENSLVFSRLLQQLQRSLDEFHQVTLQTHNMGVYFGHKFLARHPKFLKKFNDNVEHCSLLTAQ